MIRILHKKRKGFFVEIGANDGITQSNTYKLERRYGWRGVLIEPTFNNFIQCVENRNKENVFAFCACVSFQYDKELLELTYSNLMTTGKTSSIQAQKHLQRGERFTHPATHVTLHVPAKTMNQVLIDANAPKHIDLLSLDVEGAELDVLQGIDFSLYTFSYILIECWDLERIRSYLKQYGYAVDTQLGHRDWLFVQATT
tara:strand:+ start:7739 stop:8335 length:597 start_codon:yes stop_codon:yes gene_type:complete